MEESSNKGQKEIFKDSVFLKRGDLKKVAEVLNVHERSVYNVFNGTQESSVIAEGIKMMITKRKSHMEKSFDDYIGNS